MAQTALAIAIMILLGKELGLTVARPAGDDEKMMTKTISVDVDAYERASFAIRRAVDPMLPA